MATKQFITWFRLHGGIIDTNCIEFQEAPASEGGRKAIALADIPEGYSLFTIPRSLTLSTRTSLLPKTFGVKEWKKRGMDEGWAGLILCMMWEAAQGSSSRWLPYLDIVPSTFSTPMFWNQNELDELKGTSVVESLGKDAAERDYNEKLLPAVQTRPDLFPASLILTHYSMDQYHVMGSRILSRSFNVERWDSGSDSESTAANEDAPPPDDQGDKMDVDGDDYHAHAHSTSEEEDEEDEDDVTMVPMADMLNARFGSENAKLFYEEHDLRMMSTKPIKAGEQIWNTYGDLPNAELLRRYGHVDLLPLPNNEQGNPGDVVEIAPSLVVAVVGAGPVREERLEWWLQEGGDDVLVVESDLELPDSLLALIRLLLFTDMEWRSARQKSKLPKPKVDKNILNIVLETLKRRLNEYPTTLKDDDALLPITQSLNIRHAIIVRIGEKRILERTSAKVSAIIDEMSPKKVDGKNKRKDRGDAGDSTKRGKKVKTG